MRKTRNAIIILILCLIGAYKMYKPGRVPAPAPYIASVKPHAAAPDALHDAVSGHPIKASRPGLGSLRFVRYPRAKCPGHPRRHPKTGGCRRSGRRS